MAAAMACPSCGGEMVPGRLRVKGTLGGFLFVGFSWQFLWWSDPEERRASRQKLMASGEHRAADRCRSCGHKDECSIWLDEHQQADSPPDYCRNSDLIARLQHAAGQR